MFFLCGFLQNTISNGLYLGWIDDFLAISGDFLQFDAILDHFSHFFLEDFLHCLFDLFGKGTDVLVHLLDPSSFALVANLKVDGQIFLEYFFELLLQVHVIEA